MCCWWHLSNFIPLNASARGLAEEPWSLFLIFRPSLLVPSPTWCKKVPLKGPHFTLFLNCSLLLCIYILDKPFIFMTWFAVFAKFWPVFEQKLPKIRRRNGRAKKCHIWNHHTRMPTEKIIFGSWKTLRSHSFGHVIWKLWGGIPGKFISLEVGNLLQLFPHTIGEDNFEHEVSHRRSNEYTRRCYNMLRPLTEDLSCKYRHIYTPMV